MAAGEMSTTRLRQPDLDRLLGQARDVAGHLWDRGWAERNAGNLSWDVTDLVEEARPAAEASRGEWCPAGRALPVPAEALAGACLWITATGARMRQVAREPASCTGIVRFAVGGRRWETVWGGSPGAPFAPTSELPTHAAIHALLRARRAPERAVLHTHPDELIALSHDPARRGEEEVNRALLRMHPETIAVLPEGIGFVPYTLPGTLEQGLATAERLRDRRVALWQMHGVVAVGADLEEALDRVDTLNKAARLHLACRAAGFEPEGLAEEALDDLVRRFHGRERR